MIENTSRCIAIGSNLDGLEKFNSDVILPFISMCMTSNEPIHIIINCDGGYILNGFALYDLIREYRNMIPIYVHAMGNCKSAATFILLGAKKNHRFIYPNTRLMIHSPITGCTNITPDALKNMYDENNEIKSRMLGIYSNETNLELKKLKYILDHENQYWFFSSEYAISSGMGVKPDKKWIKRYWNKNEESSS